MSDTPEQELVALYRDELIRRIALGQSRQFAEETIRNEHPKWATAVTRAKERFPL